MVLLSVAKQILYPEKLFERGHPVQLLLYLFNQFNQEAAVLLLNQIEILCPEIPKQSQELIDKADKIYKTAYDQHQYYQSAATDEEKEYIEFEMKKKNKKMYKKNRKQIKKAKKKRYNRKSSQKQQNADDDQKETEEDDETDKNWMDAEQFQLCDLLYRKAIKLSPNCIKSHLKLTKFMFQTNKISAANKMHKKIIKMIKNAISHRKGSTPKQTARLNKKSKLSRNSGINILALGELQRLQTLIMSYFGYMHYMQDDVDSFEKALKRCLEREPKNIGMRCQYVVALTSNKQYEKCMFCTVICEYIAPLVYTHSL